MIKNFFIKRKKEKNKASITGYRIRNYKMILLTCDLCGKTHDRLVSHYNKMKTNELFSKDFCNECWRPILNNRPDKIKKMREGLKKTWNSLEKRKKMSEKMKEVIMKSGYMFGENNPMKNKKTRKKVGATRSKNMTKEERKKYSKATKKAWEQGKFIGKNTTGKCIWHDYVHSNGELYKVQGTWELKFIKWLDENNLEFKCHEDRINYIDDENNDRNYYPDFYIYKWESYVDIKSDYSFRGQKRKFEILKKTSTTPIKLLFKNDLIKLGIKIY
jgi:hypothetical protein